MASTESQASVSSEAAKAVNIGWVLRDMIAVNGCLDLWSGSIKPDGQTSAGGGFL